MAKQVEFNNQEPIGNPASQPKTMEEAAHDVPGAPPHAPAHAAITQAQADRASATDSDGDGVLNSSDVAPAADDKKPGAAVKNTLTGLPNDKK